MNHLLVLLASALVFSACDGEMGADNMSSGPDADMASDAADVDSADQPDDRLIPADSEPNNSPETAVDFLPGDTLVGTIGEAGDLDFYAVQLTGGSILEFEFKLLGAGFEAGGQNNAVILFERQSSGLKRFLYSSSGTSRQVFVPEDGVYTLMVYDWRSQLDEPQEHGGPSSDYEITTALVTIAAQGLVVEEMAEDELTEGVAVYALTPTSDTAFVAETTAQRAPVSSDLNTVLSIWSVSDATTQGTNDDFEGQATTKDSRLTFGTTANQPYWLVVEGRRNINDARYTVSLKETDDAPGQNALRLGSTKEGAIEDVGPDTFDTDFYELTLKPGESVRIEVAAMGDLEPRIKAMGRNVAATSWPIAGRAALEFSNRSDPNATEQVITLEVDDFRNVGPDADQNPVVGGNTYGYTLTVTDPAWAPEASSLPLVATSSINDVGQIAWFEFDVPTQSILGLSSSAQTGDFTPLSTWITPNGTVFFWAVDRCAKRRRLDGYSGRPRRTLPRRT